jgi:hypothetical protein
VDVAAALWGGIVGAIAMAVVYVGFLGLRLTSLDLVRFEGGLLARDSSPMVYIYGAFFHLALGAVLALGYRWIFQQIHSASYVGWGALVGLAQGMLLVLLLPLLGMVNRNVRAEAEPEPGLLGRRYGRLTPVGVVVACVVFGVWVGAFLLP